jgi:hypothetical protein
MFAAGIAVHTASSELRNNSIFSEPSGNIVALKSRVSRLGIAIFSHPAAESVSSTQAMRLIFFIAFIVSSPGRIVGGGGVKIKKELRLRFGAADWRLGGCHSMSPGALL